MPRKKKTVKLSDTPWAERLFAMKRHQEVHSGDWKRYENLLFGHEGPGPGGGALPAAAKKKHRIRYAWGLIKGLETTVYVQNPDCLIDPISPSQTGETGKHLTQIVTYDMEQMDLKSHGNMAMQDQFCYGYGAVIEVVETFRGKKRWPKPEELEEPAAPPIPELQPEGGEMTPEPPGEEEISDQVYTVRRIPPRDILFDPQGKLLDLSDHRYIAVAWYPTVGELQDDPAFDLPEGIENYPEASSTEQRASPSAEYRAPIGGGGEKDSRYRKVCVWEIYDKVGHEVVYVTDHCPAVIGKTDWPVKLVLEGRELFPVTLMAMNPISTRFYPVPEIELIESQLDELNTLEKLMHEDSVEKWRKWVSLAGLIDPKQWAQLTDPAIHNAIIPIDTAVLEELVGAENMGNIDLSRLIVKLDDNAMTRDLPLRKQIVEADIQHIIGYGPGDRGGLARTRSAREAMMVNERTGQRLQKRFDAITDFYRLWIAKHVMFLQQTMAVSRYAKIHPDVRKPKFTEWITYGRRDILGKFHFTVYAGTSGPKTTESKRASELQLFQTGGSLAQASGLDVRPFFYRLAEAYQWDDVDNLFSNLKQELKLLAGAAAGMQNGTVPPEQLLNQVAKVVMAGLNQTELAEIAAALEGGAAQGGRPAGQALPAGQRGDQAPLATSAGTPGPGMEE